MAGVTFLIRSIREPKGRAVRRLVRGRSRAVDAPVEPNRVVTCAADRFAHVHVSSSMAERDAEELPFWLRRVRRRD